MDYARALALQRVTVQRVASGSLGDTLFLLEHPPVYTLGKRGGREFILVPEEEILSRGARIVQTDRGGLVTFHGPGQLVGYPIIKLQSLHLDLKGYVGLLLDSLVGALRRIGVDAKVDMTRPGVYVQGRKIAAVGVRLSHGVTSHGFALNVSTDLSWYDYIVACGLKGVEATSISKEIGRDISLTFVSNIVASTLAESLGLELVEE